MPLTNAARLCVMFRIDNDKDVVNVRVTHFERRKKKSLTTGRLKKLLFTINIHKEMLNQPMVPIMTNSQTDYAFQFLKKERNYHIFYQLNTAIMRSRKNAVQYISTDSLLGCKNIPLWRCHQRPVVKKYFKKEQRISKRTRTITAQCCRRQERDMESVSKSFLSGLRPTTLPCPWLANLPVGPPIDNAPITINHNHNQWVARRWQTCSQHGRLDGWLVQSVVTH